MTKPNSTFNRFFENTKDYWDTGTEVPAGEIIHNST